MWKDRSFKDQRAVVFTDVAQARTDLARLDGNNLRFVYAPKRLSPSERNDVYFGAENRNLIVLLEPKSDLFNALDNADIIKWAQRAIAASDLEKTASDSERRKQYEKISKEDTDYLLDAFKRAGLVFVWMQPQPGKSEMLGEIEPLGSAASCEDVKRFLREDVFPRQRFEEHLSSRLQDVFGKTVRQVDVEYKKTLGFPVRTAEAIILGTVKNLCKSKLLGLRHPKDSPCGRYPDFPDSDLEDARIEPPFEDFRASAPFFIPEEKEQDLQEEPEETDPNGSENGLETPEASRALESIQTTFAKSIGALRQEIAQKLDGYEKVTIKKAQFRILSEQNNIDLGSLSSQLRGTINGPGDFMLDIIINKRGDFSKAQIEQMVESLALFNGAQYKAELKAEVNIKE
jgi:hypothetical protein